MFLVPAPVYLDIAHMFQLVEVFGKHTIFDTYALAEVFILSEASVLVH